MKTLLSVLLLSISISAIAQDSLKLVGIDKLQGDPLKTISKCEKRLKKHPDDQDSYFKLAVSYYQAGDVKKAVATWDQLIALNASYPASLANRGICSYYLHNTDGTCEDFVRSVESGMDYDIMKDKKLSDYIKVHCQ